ncbi:hypothetical protein ACFLT4_04260 [Chloroflexota bacterium]
MKGEYEVLRPWADADQQPLLGLSPRVKDLEGKTVGLLFNTKVAARPILTVIEENLKQRYPAIKTSWYMGRTAEGYSHGYQGPEQDMENAKLRDWVNGVDAVVAAIGD